MQFSFSGALAPYTYNCPYAYYLKNIKRVVIEPHDDTEVSDEPSKRQLGIELHASLASYLRGDTDEFEYPTPLIEQLRLSTSLVIETTEFYGMDFSPLDGRPQSGDFVSVRKDAINRTPYKTTIYDWKFGSSEYGAARHYDELQFFVASEAAKNPDVGEWEIQIHFPREDYTLPVRTYSVNQISRIQSSYIQRIEMIRSDRWFKPKPSRGHCRFCNYRSADTGGSNHCEFTSI